MGNTNSNVTSGVKAQASGDAKYELYKFLNMGGTGELVDLMKKANRTKDYTELDDRITEGLRPYMYNDGEGKMMHIREIIKHRARDRGNELDEKMADTEAMDEKELQKHGEQYKDTCYKLDARGAVGENPLHVCLLTGTSIHSDLAKRLTKIYPNLVKDFYISDEYYGENIVHMAIVNEDPALLKFFLDHGADVNQRSCGNFFIPDDQKDSRKDSLLHEWYDLPQNTTYEGYTAWGEYPLGFAACLGQEECVRLLHARGADPNLQDTNGNTVLHMLVIHDQRMRDRTEKYTSTHYMPPEEMFDLCHDLGGKLHIKNNLGLTPLTLAAKLARKDMFEHILEIEREVYWIYGNVTCAAYPLDDIDTISETGEINTNSAIYHIVFGESPGHLTMLEGVISNLLQEKWKTYAKFRFRRRMGIFILYFIVFVYAFYERPGTDARPTYRLQNVTDINGTTTLKNTTILDPCYLLKIYEPQKDIPRFIAEIIVLLGATVYVFLSLKEIYHQGFKIFFQTLYSSPAKTIFLLANFFVIFMVPGRAGCFHVYEDVMGILAILSTAPYFLFFARGFKIVGPFVVMIYKMVRTDLLRFFTIYMIFLIGFSQSFYVIFRASAVESKLFDNPAEALMGLLLMSLGEFGEQYQSFESLSQPYVEFCKIIFVLYMVLVTLLLVNMLIAMMGNTYQSVNETQNEWLRQWAKIILVVEQTVTTEDRKRQRIKYSHEMQDLRRALVIRWHQTEKEQETYKELRDLHKAKLRAMLQTKMDINNIQKELLKMAHPLEKDGFGSADAGTTQRNGSARRRTVTRADTEASGSGTGFSSTVQTPDTQRTVDTVISSLD